MAKGLKILKIYAILLILLIIVLPSIIFISCKNEENDNIIKLYNIDNKSIEEINFESYIEGVVAGEIQNTAPLEALKAQAILARSFTAYFIENNKSKYDSADISNDITEAQAYNKEYINDNIKKAVRETKGIVLTHNDNYINTWFHSNSGGQTTSLREGLSYLGEEPSYIKTVSTTENENNTKNYKWSATFTKSEILNSLRNMGVSVSTINSFEKGEIGNSGRCLTFNIGGKYVNANTFRLNIGSTKLKSTLIENITVSDDSVSFSGKGYGHGVGLSQEYAVVLANEGKDYKEIIKTFYKDIEFKNIN